MTHTVTYCPCERCGHPPSWHRLDDSLNIGPDDPEAKFRCIGYDCEVSGPVVVDGCDCPDFVGEPDPEFVDSTEEIKAQIAENREALDRMQHNDGKA